MYWFIQSWCFLGFSDLWGYQVYIAGKDHHAGHSDCHQINSKVHFTLCVCMHCIHVRTCKFCQLPLNKIN